MHVKKYNASTHVAWITIITFFTVLFSFGYGYVANIVSLVQSNALGGLEIARAIGIILAPLGIVLGYI